jgi:hypothetical protein
MAFGTDRRRFGPKLRVDPDVTTEDSSAAPLLIF